MSPFEYIVVLISIIIGLGITTLLTGLANIIKNFRKVKVYTPYMIWIVLAFILHVYEWWETYSLIHIKNWNLPTFLYIVLYPISLFILANLLNPTLKKGNYNLREIYFRQHSGFFSCMIILALLAILQNMTIGGYSWVSQFPQMILVIIVSSFLIFKIRNTHLHLALSVLLTLSMLSLLIITRNTLIIGE